MAVVHGLKASREEILLRATKSMWLVMLPCQQWSYQGIAFLFRWVLRSENAQNSKILLQTLRQFVVPLPLPLSEPWLKPSRCELWLHFPKSSCQGLLPSKKEFMKLPAERGSVHQAFLCSCDVRKKSFRPNCQTDWRFIRMNWKTSKRPFNFQPSWVTDARPSGLSVRSGISALSCGKSCSGSRCACVKSVTLRPLWKCKDIVGKLDSLPRPAYCTGGRRWTLCLISLSSRKCKNWTRIARLGHDTLKLQVQPQPRKDRTWPRSIGVEEILSDFPQGWCGGRSWTPDCGAVDTVILVDLGGILRWKRKPLAVPIGWGQEETVEVYRLVTLMGTIEEKFRTQEQKKHPGHIDGTESRGSLRPSAGN